MMDEVRTPKQLRHDLRGHANTVFLCTLALGVTESRNEQLEYLGEIISGAESFVATLDQFEAATTEPPQPR
jgi:hypothetical protein